MHKNWLHSFLKRRINSCVLIVPSGLRLLVAVNLKTWPRDPISKLTLDWFLLKSSAFERKTLLLFWTFFRFLLTCISLLYTSTLILNISIVCAPIVLRFSGLIIRVWCISSIFYLTKNLIQFWFVSLLVKFNDFCLIGFALTMTASKRSGRGVETKVRENAKQ